MSDILEQLTNYRAHFDRAIGQGAPSDAEPKFINSTDPGEVIVVDIKTREEETSETTGSWRSLWLRRALTAAAVVMLIGGTVWVFDRGDETVTGDTSTGPERIVAVTEFVAVIESYASAYNSRDIDAVMAFFSEESVIVGHPFTARAEGLAEIRSLQLDDIFSAAAADAYSFSNFEVSDNTVTWDHNWTNSFGVEWCAAGHSAVVDNGIIVSWTWPPTARCA